MRFKVIYRIWKSLRFEFLMFSFMLISIRPFLNIKLCINCKEPFEIGIIILNTEILDLYIDGYKTHFGLLGFGFNLWYRQTEE